MSVRDEMIEEVAGSVYLRVGAINRNDVELVWSLIEATALARGWKMTPREMTQNMEDERDRLWEGDNIEGIWEWVWDASPSPGDEE